MGVEAVAIDIDLFLRIHFFNKIRYLTRRRN
jgi:hypothetical protein